MRRTILIAIIASLFAVSADFASADPVGQTYRYIRRGYCHNKMWPWPNMCPDRMAAREPFEIMIRNGWRRHNMLGSHHFDPATNELNVAGQLHVRWVMTQAPESRRQLFIERSVDPNVTDARVAATNEYATKVALNNETPQIEETNLVAEGRPAATVDWTNVQFIENMPPPKLPPPQGSSSP